jgi:riboflavin kinase/FMN adenylyltransferase
VTINAAVLPGTGRTTVTVGTFDGIHRGHREVLDEIVLRAAAAGRAFRRPRRPATTARPGTQSSDTYQERRA